MATVTNTTASALNPNPTNGITLDNVLSMKVPQLKQVLRTYGASMGHNPSKSDLIGRVKTALWPAEFPPCGQDVSGAVTTVKTPHCDFRLVNTMFLDPMVDLVNELEAHWDRAKVDERSRMNRRKWETFGRYFRSNDPRLAILISDHPAITSLNINPAIVVPHDDMRLKSYWNDLVKITKVCIQNSKTSGTHGQDFWEFCQGDARVLYLNTWLEKKPQLLDSVAGTLPDDAQVDTFFEADGPPRDPAAEQSGREQGRDNNNNTKQQQSSQIQDKMLKALADFQQSRLTNELDTTLSSIMTLKRMYAEEEDVEEKNQLRADIQKLNGKKKKLMEEITKVAADTAN